MEEYLKLCKISLSIDEDDTYYDNILNVYIDMTIERLIELLGVKDKEELISMVKESKIKTIIISNVTYLFNNRESYVDNKSSNKIIRSLLNSIRGVKNEL